MAGGLTPEQEARQLIDKQLTNAGWVIQDRDSINLQASTGIAVREVNMGDGRADYLLYVDKRIVGVIEAKPAGVTLAEVHAQAMRYAESLTAAQKLNAVTVNDRLPSTTPMLMSTFMNRLKLVGPGKRCVHSQT